MPAFRMFLARFWATGLVLAAAVYYTATYVPAAFFAGINADELAVLVFYRDVFQEGHPPAGWILPGASCLFPDWSICFLLNYLMRDGLRAETTLDVVFFTAWLALTFALGRAWRTSRPEVFFALVVLIAVLMTRDHLSHVGAMLNTLGCLILTMPAWRDRPVFRLTALAILSFLGATSDPLFVVIFTGPAAAALGAGIFLCPAGREVAARLLVPILLGSGAGYLGAPWMFPVPASRAAYTQVRWDNILTCADGVWMDLSVIRHPWFVSLVALDVLILIAGGVAAWNFRRNLRAGSPLVIFLFAYSFFLVSFNWGALLVTNSWSIRYVFFPLVWPLFPLAAVACEWFRTRPRAAQVLAIGVACYTVYVALHPLGESRAYRVAFQRAADLRVLMAQEHMQEGLGEYWIANTTTYLSGQTVRLRPMSGTGFYHWFSNEQWMTGDPGGPLPQFRYIFTSTFDTKALRALFGPPDRTVRDSLYEEIWIYSEANAITYHPIFGRLGNRHNFPKANEEFFPAAALPSQTGSLQDTVRVAREGRDPEGCLTFGPYLQLRPGRYRGEFTYTYLKAPASDRPATFDCTLRQGTNEILLDQASIPYLDTAPKVLSREVMVPSHAEGAQLEMRFHYQGSGDVAVESLRLTYLGP